MTAGDIVSNDFKVINPYCTTSTCFPALLHDKFLVIMRENSFEGILTIEDIIRNPKKIAIDCISQKTQIDSNLVLEELDLILRNNRLFVAPVFKKDQFLGVVTADTVIKQVNSKNDKYLDFFRKIEKLDNFNLLTRGIIHDINNILTVLFDEVDMINQVGSQNGMRHNANRIMGGLKNISLLVKSIMNFSRYGTVCNNQSSVKEIIEETASFFLIGKPIKLTLNIENSLNFILIKKMELSQILSNIIVNSIQAMPRGGLISIDAGMDNTSTELNKANTILHITVKDSGIGIRSEELDNIFNAFYTTKVSGNGIGLNLCKELLKRIGGDIIVKSEYKKGTEVIVDYPLN